MITRFAPAHRQQVIALLAMQKELAPFYKDYDLDISKIETYYDYCARSPDAVGYVALQGMRVVGVIAGYVAPMIFSTNLYAHDFVFLVAPGTQGSGKIAKQLVQAYVGWAKERGATSINIGVTLSGCSKGASTLLKHLGFKCVVHTYELGDV